MSESNRNHGDTSVSRRSFFQLTFGSISLLPTVASALALAPQVAVADDREKRAGLAASSTIYVVSPKELGLVVRDVTIEDGSANLIKDAHVKIISRYNGKELEGDTDDKGVVHFDISELAEDQGKQETIPRYAFNATIEVCAAGYREFRTSLIRVDGGTALGIPTQPRVSGLPYPKCTSFDEWDILYSGGDDATFVSAKGNDAEHTVALTLKDCPAGARVTAGIFADGERLAKTTVTADSDGTAKVEIKDHFLQAGGSAALPTGEDRNYTVRYLIEGTTYEAPIKLNVTEAAPEVEKPQIKKDLELTPFNDTTMFTGITVPKSWPVIGGAKFRMWQPSFCFDARYDPFGFLLIKLTTPEIGYKSDKGGDNEEKGWMVMPRKWPGQAYKDSLSNMVESTAKAFSARGGKGFWKQASFTSQFSFTVQAEIMAAAMWEFSEKESRGRAGLGATVAANYSFTEQFWAGPFPLFVRFGVSAGARFAAEMGFISPSVWEFSKYRWDYSSSGIDIQLFISPTLSVGIGISGVSSVSLKGTFSITFCIHSGVLPAGYEDLPDPRLRLAMYAGAFVEAELLWFTKVWKIWDIDEPRWWDNWEQQLKAREAAPSELEGKSLSDALGESEIITASSLEQVAEFETSGLQAMNPQEKKLMGYTLFERTAEGDRPVARMYLAKERAASFASQAGVKLESAAAGDEEATVQLGGADTTVQLGGTDAAAENAEWQGVTLDGQAEAVAVAAATVKASDGSDGIEVVGDQGASQQPEAPAIEAAQAEQNGGSEPTYILRPSNDEIVALETGAADARPIGEHDYQEVGHDAPGVLKLGLEQGFRPTTDIRLAENILLPQRQKLFTVGDADYIARIGAVLVAGQVRTRIICSQVNGSDRRVLDFASTYGRDECFDYDFDIDVARVDGRDVVDLVVISGERPEGDATKLAQAATKTYFSFVSCTDWNAGTFTGLTVVAAGLDTIGDRCMKYKFRNYSNPRLVHIKDIKDGKEYCKAAVAYLERAATSEDQIMGTNPNLTAAGVGVVFFTNGDDTINIDSLDVMRSFNHYQLDDPTITEIALSGRADGFQMLEVKSGKGTRYALLETDPCNYIWGDGSALARLLSARMVDLGAYAGKITRLIPMEGGSYFLTCADGMLKRVDVQPGDETTAPWLEYSDFGGSELNMDDFGVLENGDVLYWPAMRTNGGYQIDPDGAEAPKLREGEEGELNLIMGARVRNGKLSKAFALGEVSHPITRIRTFGNSDEHMSFISSNSVDLSSGKGELWYTVVPWVRCANLLEATPYSAQVARGERLPFYVELRNDGNCYLSGVELTVAEVGGAAIGTIRLNFGEDTLVPSAWNPRNEDGVIENVEDDWALAPGTTSRYLTSSVTIPDNWEGEKEVEVFVSAAYGTTVRFAEGLLAQGEQHSIEYLPEHRVKAGLKLAAIELKPEERGSYSVSDVSIVKGRGVIGGNKPSEEKKADEAGKNDTGQGGESGTGGQDAGNASGGADAKGAGSKSGNSDQNGSGSYGRNDGGDKSDNDSKNGGSKSSNGSAQNGGNKSGSSNGNGGSKSGGNGSKIGGQSGSSSGSGATSGSATTRSPSTPSTGDAYDAYKQGSMPKTGDPTNLTTAAAVAIGGAATIAAAKALRDSEESTEDPSDE